MARVGTKVENYAVGSICAMNVVPAHAQQQTNMLGVSVHVMRHARIVTSPTHDDHACDMCIPSYKPSLACMYEIMLYLVRFFDVAYISLLEKKLAK